MNAENALLEAYREWHRLAEAEGEAIRACNWSLLSACQKALQHLQERTTQLSQAARSEWAKSQCDRAAKETMLTEVVRRLIGLERRNQTLLHAVRQAAEVKFKQLNRAGRNLKQIRSSYGLWSRAESCSYS